MWIVSANQIAVIHKGSESLWCGHKVGRVEPSERLGPLGEVKVSGAEVVATVSNSNASYSPSHKVARGGDAWSPARRDN